MNRIALPLNALACAFALAACSLTSTVTSDQTSSSSVTTTTETANVSYVGTVQRLSSVDATAGTHQLILQDGRMLLLESALLTLDDYVGKQVSVLGSVRLTADGGIIMRVGSVTILSVESSSSSDASSEMSSEESSSSNMETSSESSAASSAPAPATSSRSAAPVSSIASSAPAAASSQQPVAATDIRVKTMAKDDLSPSKWTQQYCSSHIGFCVPIHKNWWYTSFGTTGSALWHVEVNGAAIENLGDGVIVVNLMTGATANDGAVTEQGDFAIGYRSWKDGTHFEISAPLALKAAVAHMTTSLSSYNVSQ